MKATANDMRLQSDTFTESLRLLTSQHSSDPDTVTATVGAWHIIRLRDPKATLHPFKLFLGPQETPPPPPARVPRTCVGS